MYLRVITGLFDFPAALHKRGCDLAGFFDCLAVERRRNLFQFLVERIEQHDAVFAEDSCHQFRERFREAGAVSVALTQITRDLWNEFRRSELRDEFVDRLIDSFAKRDAAHGHIVLLPAAGVTHRFQLTFAINHLRVIDFFIVVVFAGDPKDRHRLDALIAQASGELDHRQRFVNRVQRTREQTRLLPGHDCNRTLVPQHVDVLEGELG